MNIEFSKLDLDGAFELKSKKLDQRGWFARLFLSKRIIFN